MGALAGIRVIDLATPRAELCGRVLADLGAEVIKVEPPGGAEARRMPPFDHRDGESLYWATVSLGKRSVIADAATSAGQERIRALAATADVLVESWDPGVASRRRLGYRALSALNPGLVYVSVSPYGQTGPWAKRPSTDMTLEAAGGLLGLQGDGDRPPLPVGYPQASFHAGLQAATDAIIALNERAASGRGQRLDVSMHAAIVWTLMNATGYPPNTGANPPTTSEFRTNPPTEIVAGVVFPSLWECADGWIQISVTLGGLGARTLRNLLVALDAEGDRSADLAPDWLAWTASIAPGAVDPEDMRTAIREIGRYLKTKTKAQLAFVATENQLLMAPIRSLGDVLADPQMQARGYWQEIAGRSHPGAFAKLSRTPIVLGEPATLGAAAVDGREPRARSGSRRRRSQPFAGLRVADFAWVGVGPLIAKAFADHGATVVHVESSLRPDVLRLGPPFKDGLAGINRSQFQANFNSSKLGLSLNLGMEEGRAVARRVVDWADVTLESFAPGTLAHFGFDYDELSKSRPELIMLSTCLCGQTGPLKMYRGFGTQGSALAGIHGLTCWPDRPPKGTWGAYTDFIAPRYGVAALAAAILERRTSGLGQYIDLSQVEAAAHFVEPLLLDLAVNGVEHGPKGHESLYAAPHGVFRTAGRERYVAIACETPAHWRALRKTAPLGRFASRRYDDLAAREAVDAELDAVLRDWCAEQEPWALAGRLAAAGVPAAVVARPSDLYVDPQLAHRGFFVECEHLEMGATPYDGPVTNFSATPAKLSAAPILGQHNELVLREILGYSEDEMGELYAAGALE